MLCFRQCNRCHNHIIIWRICEHVSIGFTKCWAFFYFADATMFRTKGVVDVDGNTAASAMKDNSETYNFNAQNYTNVANITGKLHRDTIIELCNYIICRQVGGAHTAKHRWDEEFQLSNFFGNIPRGRRPRPISIQSVTQPPLPTSR